ncbi:MAG TPA: hypothetical protein VD927_15050 [Chryseosolibacter sp.]|nr:hypothetical protein [Chryseosolibacter sp.]
MNILIIVLSLVSAYVLFVSVSFLLARVFFQKIEIDELKEKHQLMRARQRKVMRALR